MQFRAAGKQRMPLHFLPPRRKAACMREFFRDLFIPGMLPFGHWRSQGTAEQRRYGGVADRSDVGTLLFSVCFFTLFWIWPMLRALSCGSARTTLALTGFVWFLLILFFPVLGIVFLLLGQCLPERPFLVAPCYFEST